MEYPLYINGEWIDTGEVVPVVNPSTGEAVADVAVAKAYHVDAALNAARRACDNGVWKHLPLEVRSDFLRVISRGILERAQELAQLETLNTGKPIKETTFMDIPSAAKTFEHVAVHAHEYCTEQVHQLENASSQLVREPLGVAVLIVPWNYPLLIAAWKLASALAAGNSVVLKPSSMTPLTVLELGRIVHDAGVPAGVVNIVNGPGSQIGDMLCADSRVDMISFTGSNAVGRRIIECSAQHVKKLIMELGGKSAAIVTKDADIELAVNGSLCSIFLNQGQMCTAMSRILIEDAVYDDFKRLFVERAQRIILGPGIDFETQMGPLISLSQRNKVASCVDEARAQGARILCGGTIPREERLAKGFYYSPTVLENVTAQMNIFRNEVFGPVVTLHRYADTLEAVERANDTPFGLACSIWTQDKAQAQSIARSVEAGIIWINTYGMFYNDVPYGGFKQSGFGKELGREGVLEYTRLKTLFSDQTKDAKPLVNYWYGF